MYFISVDYNDVMELFKDDEMQANLFKFQCMVISHSPVDTNNILPSKY